MRQLAELTVIIEADPQKMKDAGKEPGDIQNAAENTFEVLEEQIVTALKQQLPDYVNIDYQF